MLAAKLAKFTIKPRGLTLLHISVCMVPPQCVSHGMEVHCNALQVYCNQLLQLSRFLLYYLTEMH